MTGEEEKALHRVMTISALIFIVMVMLLFAILASPSLSPVSAVADWDGDGWRNSKDLFPRDPQEWTDSDGDGVGDNGDAFPDDPEETSDSDGDGVGDDADFYDQGNGMLTISLESFVFKGYAEDYERVRYYPNPWFHVLVDLDDDGLFETRRSSEVFNQTMSLTDFFTTVIDVPDDQRSVRFTIVAYDVWVVSANNVTDYEVIDYFPETGTKSVVHVVGVPCDSSWKYDGREDGDTPDCVLEYSAETTTDHH